MAALRTSDGSFTVSLLLSAGLLLIAAAVSRLHDPAPAGGEQHVAQDPAGTPGDPANAVAPDPDASPDAEPASARVG